MTPEGKIQHKVMRTLKTDGWLVRKLNYEGRNGAPDLMAVKEGRCVFVECKKDEHTQPTTQQQAEHNRLRAHGALVFVIGSGEQLNAAMQILRYV